MPSKKSNKMYDQMACFLREAAQNTAGELQKEETHMPKKLEIMK